MHKFYTYILFSPKFKKHYYGHTSNLYKRLEEHNSGLSTYTKKYIPWELIYFEEFDSRTVAIKREKFFKSVDRYIWLKKNNII